MGHTMDRDWPREPERSVLRLSRWMRGGTDQEKGSDGQGKGQTAGGTQTAEDQPKEMVKIFKIGELIRSYVDEISDCLMKVK